MARPLRFKPRGDNVYHHIISRTVQQKFYLKSAEKDHFLKLLHYYSSLYFVKLIGFCIMDNHFHIIAKAETSAMYSEAEIEKRVSMITNGRKLTPNKCQATISRLEDISEYMKSIKETFAKWYNRKHDIKGCFWSERFQNTILQNGTALAQCLAYLELNPVRAKITRVPEKYRWSSIYARVRGTAISSVLSFRGLYDEKVTPFKKALSYYREYIYACGVRKVSGKGSIPIDLADIESKNGFSIPKEKVLMGKVSHFVESCAIGSEDFIDGIYDKISHLGRSSSKRKIYDTVLSKDVKFMRRFCVIRF